MVGSRIDKLPRPGMAITPEYAIDHANNHVAKATDSSSDGSTIKTALRSKYELNDIPIRDANTMKVYTLALAYTQLRCTQSQSALNVVMAIGRSNCTVGTQREWT
jgi:hypothetical protein